MVGVDAAVQRAAHNHDLILLTDCDSDSCLVQANTELSAELTQGTTVYLVVDGFDGAAGTYTLTLRQECPAGQDVAAWSR